MWSLEPQPGAGLTPNYPSASSPPNTQQEIPEGQQQMRSLLLKGGGKFQRPFKASRKCLL